MIQSLTDVFMMEAINSKTRAKVIIKLGRAINDHYGSNITESLVYELVTILDPDNKILRDPHYLLFIKDGE